MQLIFRNLWNSSSEILFSMELKINNFHLLFYIYWLEHLDLTAIHTAVNSILAFQICPTQHFCSSIISFSICLFSFSLWGAFRQTCAPPNMDTALSAIVTMCTN